MIVVDTNILVYFYIQGDFTEAAAQVHAKDADWVAPFLWRSEFRNTALLFLHKELLTVAQVIEITQTAQNRMRDYEFHVNTDKVFQLASQGNCSAYDCEFIALSKELQIPLITADTRILREFPNTAVSPEEFIAD